MFPSSRTFEPQEPNTNDNAKLDIMAPIDYSKWDNIDTDSEGENFPPKQPPAPAAAAPTPAVPPAPASAAAPASTTSPSDGRVQAVIVRCDGEKLAHMPWSAASIPADNDIFSHAVPPIPALIGIPLVFQRILTPAADRAELDNQIATYINIDATSGFAPPEWQSYVGTVVVARKDRKPLLPQHLEGVYMFCDYILDLFGEGDGPPRYLYSREGFEEWWGGYCEEQRERPGTGGERDPDDWRAVRSPYDV